MVAPSSGDGGGSASGTSDAATTIIEGTTLASASGGTDSGSSSGDACPPLPAFPPQTEITWCTGAPSQLPPLSSKYVDCLDGFVEFRHSEASDGFLFYDVSAQFYTVQNSASGAFYGEILDPYDGTLDDCALYEFSGDFDPGEVEFADSDDVAFAFGDLELAGQDNGSGSVFANAADAGLQPQFLAGHGFTLIGDVTEDFSDAVTLPDPIVITSPPTDGTGVVARESFSITWEPSEIGRPLELTLLISEDDQPAFTLFCRMDDDGAFTVPASIACQLPAAQSATAIFTRADRRVVTTEDGRTLAVAIETSVRPSLTLD